METIKNEELTSIEESIEESKPYTFRKFKSCDMFIMFKLLSKIGFKDFKKAFEADDVKEAIAKAKEEGKKGTELVESIQTDVMLGVAEILLSNAEKCQDELFKMLAAVSNITEEEVADLSLADFASMLFDFVQKDDFEDFIKVVSRLFK